MSEEIRAIITFYDLNEEWQKEAVSNLGNEHFASEQLYLEPLKHQTPNVYALIDLSEAMPVPSHLEYHAVIGISNNSALGLEFLDDNHYSCVLHYL